MAAMYLIVIALASWGCENDIERVSMLTDETKVPRVKGNKIEVIYSDSARVNSSVASVTRIAASRVPTRKLTIPPKPRIWRAARTC